VQLCMSLCHIIKFCSLFGIFLTRQSEVDFGIALVSNIFEVYVLFKSN